MGMSDQPFDVLCPDCGSLLTIDPVTRAVIAHTAAKPKKTFEDFSDAERALKQADQRREDVLAKKFEEAFKKAKESPVDERPFREFDLD
jgi:hypothetical protein